MNGIICTLHKIYTYIKNKSYQKKFVYKKVITIAHYTNKYNRTRKKVIVIGPTNDWYYMVQRPQQLAFSFSKHGYFVLYISHWSFVNRNSYIRINDTLHVLESADIDHVFDGLENAVIIFPQNFYWNDKRDKLESLARKNLFIYEYLDHIDSQTYQGNIVHVMNDFFKYIIQKQALFLFIATSEVLYNNLKQHGVQKLLYSPNGVDTDHFSNAPTSIGGSECSRKFKEILQKNKPLIGFFGALADWLDYNLVNEAAALCTDYEFVFIGPKCTHSELPLNTHLSNVTWIETVPYAELPAYAAYFDVGIIPFCKGELARSTSPVKLFEYFALGLPVVVTEDMLECRKFKEVLSANALSGFVQALRHALAMKNNNEYTTNIIRIAQNNSWDMRVEALIDFIASTGDRPSGHSH